MLRKSGPVEAWPPGRAVHAPPASHQQPPTLRSLLVQLVLAVYVPALVAAVVLVAVHARTTTVSTQEDLQARTVALGRALRVRLETVRAALRDLAEDPAIDAADWRAFDASARRAAAAVDIDSVILGRTGGEQIVNTRLPWGAQLPHDSPELLQRVGDSGRSQVVPVTRGRATGKLVVGASIPVMRNGRVAYVLTGVLDVARLQALLDASPPGWISAVVDSNGVIAARNPASDQLVGRTITADLRERIAGSEAGTFQATTLDGVPVLTAHETDPSTGWTAVMSVPRAILYEPVWRQGLLLAGGAALLLAFSLSLAVRLQRSIVGSMHALVNGGGLPARPGPLLPLGFQEANDVRNLLRSQGLRLSHAQRSVERMHQDFQRALVQQTDRRQAEVAAELHDAVGSTLSGVLMLLAQLRARATGTDAAQLSVLLREVQRAVDGVRRISRGMLPAGQERGGLAAALEQLATEVGRLDCRSTFQTRGDCASISADAGGHLFRIAQEAITNAVRHGHATRVRTMLVCAGGLCRLTIDDDGHGDRPPNLLTATHGVGLRSMRTRAQVVDGVLEVMRSPLGGWRIRVTLRRGAPRDGPEGTDTCADASSLERTQVATVAGEEHSLP